MYKEILELVQYLDKNELIKLKAELQARLNNLAERDKLVNKLDPMSGFMSTETNKPLRISQLKAQVAKWGIDYGKFALDVFADDNATRQNMMDDAHVAYCTIQKAVL